MSTNIRIYEVRVEVSSKGSKHFSSRVGKYIETKVVKMLHIDARTDKQARLKGSHHGRVISVHKIDTDRMRGSVEGMMLRLNPYPDAIAMDEMIWRRKQKHVERIKYENRERKAW